MPDTSKLLQNLNQEQQEAVIHNDGPLLIIAGAGTGKTTVITKKIAWLLEQGMAKPEEILALTFTDKAAEEMEERVDKLVPYGTFDMWISTFHSFGQKLIEANALDIGLSPDYKLLNTTESWLLIRKNLYKFKLDYYRPRGNPTKFIHALIKIFSRLKDENITPEEYLKYAENLGADQDNTMGDDESSSLEIKRIKETAEAFYQYQQLMLDNNFLDFGDLIFYTNKLFEQRPNILKQYQNQFKYILIDEFQDTNLAQYQLIKFLTNVKSNLTLVGDDDQSIFKFRGASISNILNFKKDYPNSKEIVLTKNYRSGQEILDLAYNFIQNNNPDRLEYQLNHPDKYYQKEAQITVEKIDKKLYSKTETKSTIEYLEASNEIEEVNLVMKKIAEILSNSENTLNDIAILFRANKTAAPFIQALERKKLSFVFLASRGLYKHEVIADILAYARVLDDPADSISLSRVLSIPGFKINKLDLLKINQWSQKKSKTFFETLENIRTLPDLQEKTVRQIELIIQQIKDNRRHSKNIPAVEMIVKLVNDTKYREYLIASEKKDPLRFRQEIFYINQLMRKLHAYTRLYDDKTLSGFVEHIKLEREAGDSGAINQDLIDQGPEAIRLMTLHSAKGLEFKYVFIAGLAQHRFPTIRRSDPINLPTDLIKQKEILPEGDEHIQEERRLFYVGVTRAKEGLFLSTALNYGGKRQLKPSSFLKEAGLISDNKKAKIKQPQIDVDILTQPSVATNLSLRKKLKYPIPEKFSFSQLAAFIKCPLQYKYQFILKIPQDKGKASLSFGKTMHDTMLEIMKQTNMRSDLTQASLFGSVASSDGDENRSDLITLDEIYKIYEKKWQDDWYESARQKDDYYKAGKTILKEFHANHNENWPQPLYLEKPFQVVINGNVLKGRIDRIDLLPDKSGIELIDYKTGKFKEKPERRDRIQLYLYQIVLEHNDPPPKKLTFHYLNDKHQEAVSFIGNDAELEKVRAEITDTIEMIKKSDFDSTPNQFTCDFCDFKSICPDSAV